MGKNKQGSMTFGEMYDSRKAAIEHVMKQYAGAGIAMVPEFAAAGLQFDPKEFHDRARLNGWIEEKVRIGDEELIGYTLRRSKT